MNDKQLATIEQVKQFLEENKSVEFRGLSVEEKYDWIETVRCWPEQMNCTSG